MRAFEIGAEKTSRKSTLFFLSMYAKLMLMVDNGFSDCKRDVLNLCSKYIYIMYRSKIDNNLFMKVSMLARNNRVLF